MMYRAGLLALTLVLTTLSGCETIKEREATLGLESTLNAYGKVVRWGRLAQLYEFLTPELAAEATIQPGLDNIRVTGYEVLRAPVKIDDTHAVQSVLISYILRDRQVEHRIQDDQEWRFDPERKLWHRNNPIPEFR